MIARSSEPFALRRVLGDDSGAILALLVVSMLVIFGSAGLAIDLGRGYVEKMRLARAVDAGALAGARALRTGTASARSQALAVARSNGVANGIGDIVTSVVIGTNERGESTVTMRADRTVPTTFMRMLGHQRMEVGAVATAAVPPVDLVLVLDQSGSLGQAGVWGDLKQAARSFIHSFDDRIDQVGLVSFQLRAADRFQLAHDFTRPVEAAIQGMQSVGDTNIGEGLRLALGQMRSSAVRPSSARVVVFFTDGRPTASRDLIGPPSMPQDRLIAVYTTTNGVVRGYFDNPDQVPTDRIVSPDGCIDVADCFGWDENGVRNHGRVRGLQRARDLRREGAVIFTIGLGNPGDPDPLNQPDLDYLRQLANEDGIAHPNEPQGKSYFAPSAAELQGVFDQVAQDLLVRLAR